MLAKNRSTRRSIMLIFLVAALILAACGRVSSSNWPGLAANGDVVYVASGPQVLAIDVVREEEVWSFPDQPNQTLLFYAPPSVSEDQIVIGDYGASGGFFSPRVTVGIYGLDVSGELLWEQKGVANDRIVASPLQTAGTIFVGTSDNYVIALSAEDGTERWRFETGHSVWAQPVYEDGVVYVASLDRSIYALDSENGEELWRETVDGSISDKPSLGVDLVYVGGFDKHVHALEKASGARRWIHESQAAVWGSPVLAEDVVYYADLDGNVGALDAESGEPIWVESLEETVVAAPTVFGDFLLVATAGDPDLNEDERAGSLVAMDVVTGERSWQEQVDGLIFTSPAIVNNTVVIAIHEGENLIEVYDLEEGDQVWEYRLVEG